MVTNCFGLQTIIDNRTDYYVKLTNDSTYFVRFRLEYYVGGTPHLKFSVGIIPGGSYTTQLPKDAVYISIIFFYYDPTPRQFIAFHIINLNEARNVCTVATGTLDNPMITEVPCNLISNPNLGSYCQPCLATRIPTCSVGNASCVSRCNSTIGYSC